MIPQEWLDDFDVEIELKSGDILHIDGLHSLRMTAEEWMRVLEVAA